MKISIIAYSLFALLLLQCSASKEENSQPIDYLLFGTKYGKCISGCNRLYYMDGKNLYQFISKSHEELTATEFTSKGILLSQDKYNKYKNLLDFLPTDLDLSDLDTFGCPNCYDQGEIYIEYKKDNVVRKFRADTKQADNPVWLRAFAENLKLAVEDLSK